MFAAEDFPATAPDAATGPLAGIRVLDLSRVLAGPWATQLLADLGAEVLKVERPGRGDDSRAYAPFLKGAEGGRLPVTPMFLAANRGKRSVTLDIGSEKGRGIVRRLAAVSDVLVENFKVGNLSRYGLGYEDLRKVNPRLIYCSVTGFGQTGPYRDRPGYDTVIQAMCGLMSTTGAPGNQAEPVKAGPSVVDIMTGMYAANAIQAALYQRDLRGGEGQYIDLSLLDCGVALMAQQAMYHVVAGHPPERTGNSGNSGMLGGGYRCKDGYIMIAPGTERLYSRFCEAIGRPDLIADPRYRTNADRVANRVAMAAEVSQEFAKWTLADLYAALVAAGVPASPVYDMTQVMADPQVGARGMVAPGRYDEQEIRMIANPIRMSGRPVGGSATVPPVGADTDSVCRDLLGMTDDELGALRAKKVI